MKSIRNKLFLILIVMGSIPLTVALMVDSFEMINSLEEDTYREGMLRNRIVSEHLTQLCEKNFHVLHTLALNPSLREYVQHPTPGQKLQIAELLHNTNNIFNDRNLMALTGSNAIQLMRTDGSYLVNVITRKHFHEAMHGRAYVSDLIVSMSTNKMIVVIEVPITDSNNKPVGMLQRNLNLSELQQFVKGLNTPESSVVIIDRDGRIIADSDKVFNSPVELLNDGTYKQVSDKIKADGKSTGVLTMFFNGSDYLVSYSRNYATGWFVFVLKPYHYIWDEVFMKVIWSIFVTLVMFAAVAFFARKVSHTVTKPIIDITDAAEKIAHGNNSVEKIEITSDDELGQMADAFNKMRSLRDSYQLASELDKLTKLYNKSTTENICKLKLNEFDKLDDPKPLMAFFIVDLDHFKQANDTFGHQFGDKVLVEFSSKIRKIFRPNDCIGRFGGDEFIVILENLPSVDIVIRKAEQIKKLVSELTVDGVNARVTASIGIALVPPQGTDYETLFKTADQELYRVKSNGRNGYLYEYAESVKKG